MKLSEHFEDFCENLTVNEDELNKWINRIKEITKKLNKKYYDTSSDEDNILVVGSVGRSTAIHNVSDYDCIFELPSDKFKQFDNHSGNGQSALLQEVKKEIQSRYSSTEVKGDGQVVVVSFKDGDIELVPAFRQNDDNFKHPDSNNGGSWKITKPLPEIEETEKMASETNDHYINFCRLMRRWKNEVGFKFKGLLIDTMTKKFFDEDSDRKKLEYSDYYDSLVRFFKFLSEQNAECSYWLALGSNQQITNSDGGRFIKKAKKAYNKLKDISEDSDDAITKLRELFGKDFAKETEESKTSATIVRLAPNEELPEKKFIIDIQYNLKLDYTVEQDGFRPKKMIYFIQNKLKLKARKKLKFYIEDTDIPYDALSEVKWYWKVRNVGAEAVKRNCERGQIKIGTKNHTESTDFNGSHYVECYAVIGNTLIARDRVNVPIDTVFGSD
ncbi:SMODS domain-containing nucleotidyltransferase [Enterococcus faecalis]|uniref:SMODS domain-containing nucleotidyltransferase n=3 Tax=Enterococcus faecalis TaxID=1351 RepID=UPI00115CDC9A|nr:nucleotidyltransferase [Enterococcus faecalis]EGO7895548.1 nucleotidyltransferase [Enterococcus faecalis]EJR1552328.1 nucleotidyltransferase [Enterococcus faecalis]EKR9337047.1 nucleotidyltransferase [Enterococcus faecalis]MDN3187429.1 nucleotidyltransferase [Enterococcus faecalis]NSM44090.1 nucleotidyltransferase [Enterococcus faecalis]